MNILGINAYHGDASACLVQDGQLIAACEEERFNRVKHCAGLPHLSAQYCLQEGGISFEQLDVLAISRNPRANLWNKVYYMLTNGLRNRNLLKSRLATIERIRNIKDDLAGKLETKINPNMQVNYVEHHLAHMASSFFVSPFEHAALLSIDGFGDFVSTKIGIGHDNQIRQLGQVCFPHSSGILYTATSQFIGFQKYGDEGKVMGLAPYGEPKYLDKFQQIVRWKGDLGFELNLDYFKHHSGGVQMSWLDGSPTIEIIFSDQYEKLFGPARKPGDELTQYHMDIAASLQAMLELIYFRVANRLYEKTKSANICIAGGVALNSVCNGKLFDNTPFKEIYIQPAAGDGGTALGAAFYAWNQLQERSRGYVMKTAYTGPEYNDQTIATALKSKRLPVNRLSDDDLFEKTAKYIADGKIVGWFQGRCEFGPRALGHRSIVADPRRHDMKDILNKRIKHRESFRPFAPSILIDHVKDYFTVDYPAPFMLKVYPIREEMREKIPAVTHVDGSGRLQTVDAENNPRYYKLIKAFFDIAGVPIVLNTSFNENEPIVNRPEEAIDCFLKTKMDILVLGNYLVERPTDSSAG